MNQKPYICDNSEPITMEMIKEAAGGQSRIRLIKYLRCITNLFLKDAKDRVESHCCVPDNSAYSGLKVDVAKTIAFFSQWIPLTQEQKSLEQTPSDQEQTHRILKAFECVCEHWHTLGFKSKLDACHVILQVLKDN